MLTPEHRKTQLHPTWENPDLKRLLPVLRDAPRVFVVPDSDFYASDKMEDGLFNPMVVWQTRRAASEELERVKAGTWRPGQRPETPR